MNGRLQNTFRYGKRHPVISMIILAIVFGGGYFAYRYSGGTSAETRYVLAAAEKSTIISSVTGSGQVSPGQQIDVKSKVSGDIIFLNVKPGQTVKAGQLLARIDSEDASIALETAQISYEKLTRPADSGDVTAAQANIAKSYDDMWNAVSSVFVDYPDIISGMNDLFYTSSGYLSDAQTLKNLRSSDSRAAISRAGVTFDQANASYEAMLVQYNSLSRLSGATNIESITADTYEMLRKMAEALKNTQSAITYLSTRSDDEKNDSASAAADVNGWLSSINTHLGSISAAENTLATNKKSLADLTDGPDPLDVRSETLSLRQKQNAYQDYFVRAPIDAVVAAVPVQVGDSGSGATIATLITNGKIAEIPLNEIDVAKIALGQKATLTFDAVPDLSITGQVSDIDLVGTVSQGVVTYNVKITFDTDDSRIKSGMTVSAAIITGTKSDVLSVPNSAVKSNQNGSYVEVLNQAGDIGGIAGVISAVAPQQVPVEVGISNDSLTEITSGLEEGARVVTRTITATTQSTSPQAPSLFGGGGTRVGGGNATFRVQARP